MEQPARPQPWQDEETFWDRLGQKRREWEKKKGVRLSNAAIAQIAGVNTVTVSNWRKRSPGTDALLALARYFRVAPEWLKTGQDVGVLHDYPTEPPMGG